MGKRFSIADYMEEAKAESRSMEITPVPIQDIVANYRNFYSVGTLELDLAESIKVSGLLTPLGVIAAAGGKYKLISGHRRLRALRYLHDSGPEGRERWGMIPCVVYATPEDADREELMLIHANAQRVKSGPEIAEEARKTTEILVRLKERGVELPGRMRDRVAEALKISSTRLARIEAIEHNLTYPGWRRKWDGKLLAETVAYRLSQLDYDQQMASADYVINHGIKDRDITVAVIEEALRHPPLYAPGTMDPLAYETDPVKVDRELVRRMAALGRLSGVRFANRKDGMDQLKLTFRNSGHADGELDWMGESKGIRFSRPVEWLLGWGALYDALAANALDEAVSKVDRLPAAEAQRESRDAAETQRESRDAAEAQQNTSSAPAGHLPLKGKADPEWVRREDPERPGRYLAVIRNGRNGDAANEYTAEWDGEQWLVFDKPLFPWMQVEAWWPLPDKWEDE